MQNQKKIYMIIIPASGHVIPALGLAEELVKKYNTIIEFYGIEDHRELIQKTGSNFRKYSHFLKDTFAAKPLNQDKTTPIGDFFSKLIDSAYKEVPNLIKDVEEEKPDLIIYDHLCFNAKLMLKVMKKITKRDIHRLSHHQLYYFIRQWLQKNMLTQLLKKYSALCTLIFGSF